MESDIQLISTASSLATISNKPEMLSAVSNADYQSSQQTLERNYQKAMKVLEGDDDGMEQCDEPKFGSMSDDNSVNFTPNRRELNTEENEIKNMPETNDSDSSRIDSRMDVQVGENIIEDVCGHFSSTPQQLTERDYDNCTLLSIVHQLEKKNLIFPLTAKTLKDKCRKIKKNHEVAGFLKDVLQALILLEETPVTPGSFSVEAGNKDSLILNNKILESELQIMRENFQSFQNKCSRKEDAEDYVKVKNLEAINADLKKQRENMKEELFITSEKYINAIELLQSKLMDEKPIYLKIRETMISALKCEDCVRLKNNLLTVNKEYVELKKEKEDLILYNKELESKEEDSRCEVKQLLKEYDELLHEKFLNSADVATYPDHQHDISCHYLNVKAASSEKTDSESEGEEGEKKQPKKKYVRHKPIAKVGSCKFCYGEDSDEESSEEKRMLAYEESDESLSSDDDNSMFLMLKREIEPVYTPYSKRHC